MGDRCYLVLTVKKRDLPILEKIFSVGRSPPDFHSWVDDVQEDTDNYLRVSFGEANYALDKELREAAEKGAVFIAWHDAGGEYGPGLSVGFAGKFFEADTNNCGEYVVRIVDGRPDSLPLRNARRVEVLRGLAEIAMAGGYVEKVKGRKHAKV